MASKQMRAVGEFGLIEQIKKMTRTDRSVLLGIGDDAAVIRTDKGEKIIFTTDMLIQDKHFRLSEATGYEIGWKALAVNISDIAAMGGLPTHAVISVGLPESSSVYLVKDIYKGLYTLAKRFGVNIVGGDTNASEKIVISAALLGKCGKQPFVTRSGAKFGDVIFVTGSLGGSYASKKHLNFIPRIAESQFLTKNFKVHSMMDVSDGLASDIHRLTQASGVGAILSRESIPVSSSAKNTDHALTDGEDFELLFTLSPKEAARLSFSEAAKKLAPFSPIGKILPKKMGVLITGPKGSVERLPEKGFDHFRVQD